MRKVNTITLVEIMLVVVIISILAALAIPNLLRSRRFAQETLAVNDLHLISTAQSQWRATSSVYATLAQLNAANPPYIDGLLATGTKENYDFTVVPNAGTSYYATAQPQNLAQSHTYYIDEDGLMCRSDTVNTLAPNDHTANGCPAGFSELE